MFSKTIETAVKRGFAAIAGIAANTIGPAVDGSKPHVIVFADGVPDVGTPLAAGRVTDVLVNDDDRLYPAAVGADVADLTLLMATGDGSLIPVTTGNYYCAQAVIGAKAGGIAQVVPMTGYFKS